MDTTAANNTTANTIDTKILDRVKNLLAKSVGRGATPEEAATAAAIAQEILSKHGLDMAMVEAHGGKKATLGEPVTSDEAGRTKQKVVWMGRLAWGIAEAGGGYMYWHRHRSAEENYVSAIFIGRPSQVATWKLMYEFLLGEIDRLAKAAVKVLPPWENARSYGASFRLGAADTVKARLIQAAKAQRAEVETAAKTSTETCTALAIIDRDKAEVEAFKQAIKLTSGRRTVRVSHVDGYGDGKRAGEGIQLNPQVGASAPQARLPRGQKKTSRMSHLLFDEDK